MRGLRGGAVAVALLLTAGCEQLPGTPQNLAVKAVREQMLDPQAARIVILETHQGAVCGTVNGKNAMGGYVGARPFVAWGPVASVFSQPPSLDDVRMLLRMEKGADRDDLILRIGRDCELPKLWRADCKRPFPAVEGEAHLCQLWSAGQTAKLFDEVGG